MTRIGASIAASAAILLYKGVALAHPAPGPMPPALTGAASRSALARACKGHEGWAVAAPAAQISANTWYVGTCGITALLVTTRAGLVLIDSGVREAAPLVLANIRALGFDPRAVRWMLSSHEHFDHVGAHGAMQKATGARVAVLASAVAVMESGKSAASDPQNGTLEDFAPVHVDRALADGESVKLGGIAFTIHATPAHTAGSASWTWPACSPARSASPRACVTMTYADSATAFGAKGYRFADHPDRIAAVRRGHARMAALPCGLLVTPHPGASNLFARFAGTAPLIDSKACTRYAQDAKSRFDARLAQETPSTPKEPQ
ncbi:subclass B3 metallo-beta-lactamase [Novosphingobium sp. 1949]|uniref:Subclass B3 metallo-beta-lactamase n=1 Tax=Novosphingobium organovorum TaxID=2930092 RepID=A0ABT0BAA6_9SPHN|nr:subclass B3 metallo-beta-lactamase [Novosphingobium organovorum]MCJ2182007.1 subclass B3 metallo-beta-lactamase [Novosphingobium organovorum]